MKVNGKKTSKMELGGLFLREGSIFMKDSTIMGFLKDMEFCFQAMETNIKEVSMIDGLKETGMKRKQTGMNS